MVAVKLCTSVKCRAGIPSIQFFIVFFSLSKEFRVRLSKSLPIYPLLPSFHLIETCIVRAVDAASLNKIQIMKLNFLEVLLFFAQAGKTADFIPLSY